MKVCSFSFAVVVVLFNIAQLGHFGHILSYQDGTFVVDDVNVKGLMMRQCFVLLFSLTKQLLVM